MVHKLLDRVEKNLGPQHKSNKHELEASRQTSPSPPAVATTSSSSSLSSSSLNNNNDQQRQLVVHSYPPLLVRIRQITLMLMRDLSIRVCAVLKTAFVMLRVAFPCLDRLIVSADELRKNTAYKLQDRFSLTKDKLDLYKEYLDVLSRQFMVQDGRSLDHVHVGQNF